MTQKPISSLLLVSLALALSACRIEIENSEGGQVVSESGRYDCTAGPEQSCLWDIDDAFFSEVFTAIPASGYRFTGWSPHDSNVCAGREGNCALTMSSLPLTLRRSLLASDNIAKLKPVFDRTDEIFTFSVEGTIGVLEGTVLDSDTNNPDNGDSNNDEVTLAQLIGSPSTVGGYLGDIGEGEPGNASDSGDTDDYFRIDANGGELVSLFTADYRDAELDLYLYDSNGEIAEYSAEPGETEQLIIPDAGIWYINPSLYSGASNYVLTVGTDNRIRNKSELITGDVLVSYVGEHVIRPGAFEASHHDIMKKFDLRDRGGGPGRTRRLSRTPSSNLFIGNLPLHLLSKRNAIQSDIERRRWDTFALTKQLRNERSILLAEPNYRVKSSAKTNDTYINYLWHYDAINIPAAWDTTSGSPDVIVAVIDTGVIKDHPDLAGQLVDGYDFISDQDLAGDGDGIDPDPTDEGEGSNAFRSGNFHGLHVAGTIGAAGNNRIGIAGVAHSSRVMPMRALNANGEGNTYDIMQAVRYAAGLQNDSGNYPAQTASIINLSLGGGSYSASEQNLYRQLNDRGIAIVAASGNDGAGSVDFPGAYEGVFAIGATDATNRVASYSNRGNNLDLMAPGGNLEGDANGDGQPDGVLSTYYSDGQPEYFFLEGTSMATPHVAGVMALMKSVNPALSSIDIEALMVQGRLTDDLGAAGKDNSYGWGLINAQKSVATSLSLVGQNVERPSQLGASTSSINFGSSLNVADIVLSNLGDGELTVVKAEVSEDWLSIAPLNTDAAGLGVWRLTADRSSLDVGQYSASVVFDSSAGALSISVRIRVLDGDTDADIGVVYILFVESESQKVVAQAVTWSTRQYEFSLPELPQGSYEVWAGTDTDNDFYICDAGEACGAWQSLDSPTLLKVYEDLGFVEFTSDYQISLPELGAKATAAPYSQSKREFRRIN